MNEELLKRFESADWAVMQPKLTRYAERVVFDKNWRTAQGLPKGCEPADLVLEAIKKTFAWLKTGEEGAGFRKWNVLLNPNLIDHLESVIDSEASNLVLSEDHTQFDYSAELSSELAVKLTEKKIDAALQTYQGLDDSESDFNTDVFLDLLYEALENETCKLVLLSFTSQSRGFDVVKPQRAVDETGLEIAEVYNSIKKIRRTALRVRSEMQKNKKENTNAEF